MKLTDIKGIGEKTEKDLQKLGIDSVNKLINYYPRRYEHFEACVPVAAITNEKMYSVYCVLKRRPSVVKKPGNKSVTDAVAFDQAGTAIHIKWFNMPFITNMLKPGICYVFRGTAVKMGGSFYMTQPSVYSVSDYELLKKSLQPVYPLKAGISNKLLTKYIKEALNYTELTKEWLDEKYLAKYDLTSLGKAIRDIHFPINEETLRRSRDRIVFNEFFKFLVYLRELKENKAYEKNQCVIPTDDRVNELVNALPYELTKAQKRALNEVLYDMQGPSVMNRLIQGDVGSGKTIIAVLALYNAALSGYQGALMVPTEVLAKQHFEAVTRLFKENNIDISVALLTGSMKASEKKQARNMIESGETKIIIGTHTLIQESVRYNNLSLVITDEQHRFGVKQRDTLHDKGYKPHTLVMSATPIPRTLAIILYGDLDISIINTMPANRLPIKNCVITEDKRPNSYRFISNEIKKGHQAYIICPMVDENEEIDLENVIEYTQKLKKEMDTCFNIAYLHGKMKAEEKNGIMDDFSSGVIDILVSTTVIEVGINVPNATVMMIENAERFGLAQLHQLRGRVGRGDSQSYCIFVNCNKNSSNDKRLDIIGKSNDGFFIANEDLKTRGPGDLFGIRQSGEMLFEIADIYSDSDMLTTADEVVKSLSKSELKYYLEKFNS